MKRPTPVAILVRVSTKKQETDRQITELQKVAAASQWTVIEVIKENGVSGAAKTTNRPGLARAEALAASGSIKKVLVHEVSRLARRPSVAHVFVEGLEELGVSLYWHAQRIETLLPSGKRNPAAAIMFSLLSEMARAERETLVERINSGLAEARRKGVRLGRPPGTTQDLTAKHPYVVRCLKAGKSIRDTAARCGVACATVQRVKAAMRVDPRRPGAGDTAIPVRRAPPRSRR